MKFSPMILLLLGRRAAAFSSSRSSNIRDVFVRQISAATVDGEETKTEEVASTKMPDMDEIVSLCKRRGIIFPSSEIYNGYAGFYDYGPLGAELKKNIKDAWWKTFVTQREDVVGVDSSIIHNPTTWKSSGAFFHFGKKEKKIARGRGRANEICNCHTINHRILPYFFVLFCFLVSLM